MSIGKIAVYPITISDATSLAVVGLTGRQFRAFVRKYKISFATVGRRMLVRVDLLLEVVNRLSGATSISKAVVWDEDATVQAAALGKRSKPRLTGKST